MFGGEDFKCLHVLPLLGDTSKKVSSCSSSADGEDLASAKIKTSQVKKERVASTS